MFVTLFLGHSKLGAAVTITESLKSAAAIVSLTHCGCVAVTSAGLLVGSQVAVPPRGKEAVCTPLLEYTFDIQTSGNRVE